MSNLVQTTSNSKNEDLIYGRNDPGIQSEPSHSACRFWKGILEACCLSFGGNAAAYFRFRVGLWGCLAALPGLDSPLDTSARFPPLSSHLFSFASPLCLHARSLHTRLESTLAHHHSGVVSRRV